jgi:hypothetical protein
MMSFRRPSSFLFIVGVGLLVLPGCGRSFATVSGTATLPKDVKITDKDLVQITFVPDAKGEKAGSAVFNASDSTIVCKDIVPGGKYKITAKIEPLVGGGDAATRAAEFAAFNKAYDAGSTKLVFQATDEWTQTITIDFVKGTVTKK